MKNDILPPYDPNGWKNKPEEEKSISLFPVKPFPSLIQEIIKEANEHLNFPIDFFGASILYTASLSIGNTYKAKVKNGWEESALLFLVNVGKPNTNKSHPLTFALKPIFDRDAKSFNEYQKKRKEYDEANSPSQKKDKKEKKKEKPVWHKFIVDDFTPEVLADVHKFNKRGIGVYADELAGWFKNFNRYTKGSEQERWLKIWSGKPITIDRKMSEPTYIPLPFIPVMGNIQTGLLSDLAKDNRMQNGLIDRMLFAFPENLIKQSINETEINQTIVDNWRKIVSKLISIELELDDNLNPKPKLLHFSVEAWGKFKEWEKENNKACNETDNEMLASIYGKFDIHIFRLALILQILHWVCSKKICLLENISVEAMEGALELANYFKGTAVKINATISNYNPVDKLPESKRSLYEALPINFTTRQALATAELHEISQRTLKRFIDDKELFKRNKWGNYEKRF